MATVSAVRPFCPETMNIAALTPAPETHFESTPQPPHGMKINRQDHDTQWNHPETEHWQKAQKTHTDKQDPYGNTLDTGTGNPYFPAS